MASTREIRRRIRSVRNISQITRAMEMVAASKMRRSQQRVLASRPYAERLEAMIGDLASLHLDADSAAAFPLLAHREVKKVAVLLVTPDKGLTGPLTSNILRRAGRFVLSEAEAPVQVVTVGRKGRDFMIRTRQEVVAEFTNLKDSVDPAEILPITDVIIDDYTSGRVDAVYLIYPKFMNTLTQVPTVHKLLPSNRQKQRAPIATTSSNRTPGMCSIVSFRVWSTPRSTKPFSRALRRNTPRAWLQCATHPITPKNW